MKNDARPKINGTIENFDEYDVILRNANMSIIFENVPKNFKHKP